MSLCLSLLGLAFANTALALPGLNILAIHKGVLAKLPIDKSLKAVVKLSSQYSMLDYQICTGTFISDQVLVTAAHCLTRDLATDPCVDKTNCSAEAQRVLAETPAPSGDYFMEAGESTTWVLDKPHDLAIVKFPPHTFKGKPIDYRLNSPELLAELESGHATYTALGYGLTEKGDSGDALRCSSTIPVLELGALGFISRDEFRVDHGDSGGPVLARLPGRPPFIVAINDAYDPTHPNIQYFTPLLSEFFASLAEKGITLPHR